MESLKRFLILTAGGIGDQILGFQCANSIRNFSKFYSNSKYFVDIVCLARNEVYSPLKALFEYKFSMFQHEDEEKWAEEGFLENNLELLKPYRSNYDEIYFVVPDHLFRHELSFAYEKFNTFPQIIRSQRLLSDRYFPKGDIYVGLATSTEGYLYYDIPALLIALGKKFQDNKIHFPKLTKWNNKPLYLGDFRIEFPKNVLIYENPKIEEQIDLIRSSSYGIYTDNGMSHIGFQIGQPRLLLDPRYDPSLGRCELPWIARWREDLTESISIQNKPEKIADLVFTNITQPETMLVPRQAVLSWLHTDWGKKMFFKY